MDRPVDAVLSSAAPRSSPAERSLLVAPLRGGGVRRGALLALLWVRQRGGRRVPWRSSRSSRSRAGAVRARRRRSGARGARTRRPTAAIGPAEAVHGAGACRVVAGGVRGTCCAGTRGSRASPATASPATWSGVATLYGGPADLARGDEADVVATLGAPQRLWDASSGDPRPGEAHRGVAALGRDARRRRDARATGLVAWIDRVRAARPRAHRRDASRPDLGADGARARARRERPRRRTTTASFRASGLSHLLAVSGMHLVLVLALVVRAPRGAARARRGAWRRASTSDAWRRPLAYRSRGSTPSSRGRAGRPCARRGWPRRRFWRGRSGGGPTRRARSASRSLAMALADPLVAFDLSFLLSAGGDGGAPGRSRGRSREPARGGRAGATGARGARGRDDARGDRARACPSSRASRRRCRVGGRRREPRSRCRSGEAAALPLCLVHALLAVVASGGAGVRGGRVGGAGARAARRARASRRRR